MSTVLPNCLARTKSARCWSAVVEITPRGRPRIPAYGYDSRCSQCYCSVAVNKALGEQAGSASYFLFVRWVYWVVYTSRIAYIRSNDHANRGQRG